MTSQTRFGILLNDAGRTWIIRFGTCGMNANTSMLCRTIGVYCKVEGPGSELLHFYSISYILSTNIFTTVLF